MEIKNKYINAVLLTLLFYRDGQEAGGLLTENLSLGVKRKLQKIRKELLPHLEEFEKDGKQILSAFEGKDTPEDIANKKKEVDELNEEVVKLTCDHALLSEIEKIETDKNYDFDMIEMIAK